MKLKRRKNILCLVKQADENKKDTVNLLKVLGITGVSAAAGLGAGMLTAAQIRKIRGLPSGRYSRLSTALIGAAPFVAGAGGMAAAMKHKEIKKILGSKDRKSKDRT